MCDVAGGGSEENEFLIKLAFRGVLVVLNKKSQAILLGFQRINDLMVHLIRSGRLVELL